MNHFSFDEFRLEPSNQRLLRGDSPVPLPPKAFDTLVYLMENHGRLVTREELRQAVWPDSFVEDANLTVYISLLRKALGEEGGRRYIETVPRKGYRFTANVRSQDGDALAETAETLQPDSPATTATLPPPRRRVVIWASAAGVSLVLTATWLVSISLHQPPPLRHVRLTSFGPELAVTAAAISPDGKSAAYANPGGLFVQQIDTGEVQPLVTPTDFTVLSLSWFPDATKLLAGGFLPMADTPSLWVIPVVGKSAPVKLADSLIAAVSPDGAQIALTSNPRPSPPESVRILAPELRLMRSDGEAAHTLVTGEAGETFGPVAWLGDGHRLAWVRYRWDSQLRKNAGSLVLYDLDRASSSPLVAGSDFTGDVAAIAPDRIIYSQLLGANPSSKYGANLFVRGPDSRTTLLMESSEPIAGLTADAAGTRLAIRTAMVEHSVFVAGLTPVDAALVDVRRLTLGLGREDFPRAWTPDSRSVVFDSNRNGAWELYQQALDAAADQPFVHSADDSFTPRLSPDRSAYLYIDRPKNWADNDPVSIVRTPISGGPTQLVLKESGISAWGLRFECAGVPEGACVLAQQQGNQITFRTFDPVRGYAARAHEVARIASDPAHPLAWSLSPNGQSLAWSRWNASEARIHLISIATGAASGDVALSACSHLHSLHWAADGKGWFVTSEWPAGWTISYAGRDGRSRVLAHGSGFHAPDTFPSPDGRHIAFSRQIVESNLWLLEGF